MFKISILIVEDELIAADSLADLLTIKDYKVVGIANSGEKALEMFEKEQPDIILMDVSVRGELNGIETARRIREKSNISIIFQTAFCDLKTKQQVQLLDNCFYIIKPFLFSDLLKILEAATKVKT